MAYCEQAQQIQNESPGSWRVLVLRSHIARCQLCRALSQINADGYLPESVAKELGASIIDKPKNIWVGSRGRRVATIKGQELNISE